MVDFTLRDIDFSPLFHAQAVKREDAEIKKRDKQREIENQRNAQADAQNAEIFNLEKRKILAELQSLGDEEAAAQLANTFLAETVSVASIMEPILESAPGEVSEDHVEELRKRAAQAAQKLEGTPYAVAFSSVDSLADDGKWEEITSLLETELVRGGVFKEFLGVREGQGRLRGESPEGTQKERDISTLAQILVSEGVNPTEARRIAAETVIGTRDVQLSADGQLARTDALRGTGETITTPARTDPVPQVPADQTMWKMAERGTGAKSAIIDFWNRTAGQLPGVPTDRLTAQARQGLRTEQTGIIRAFALNDRYTNAQIDLIRQEIAIQPEVFDSPELMRSRMVSIDENMARREREVIDFLSDPSIPERQKTPDRALLRSIMTFREQLGVPLATSVEDMTLEAIDQMSDEELQLAVDWIGQPLENAPDEVLDELIRRREGR